jgi:hypothetical protein
MSLSAHKPRVQYSDLGYCKLGEEAKVWPLNHPVPRLNGAWVTTTLVQHIQPTSEGPVFETRNTVYMPVPQEPEIQEVEEKYEHS